MCPRATQNLISLGKEVTNDKMKVLHLSHSVTEGGAAIAAYRIHQAVHEAGVNSTMYTEQQSQNLQMKSPLSKLDFFQRKIAKFTTKRISKYLMGNLSVYFSSGLFPSPWFKHLERENADIIHLHSLGNEILSIKQISKISAPVVITVHDYWVLGSGYHLEYLDDPMVNPQGILVNSIKRWVRKRKMKYWKDKNITFVAPSKFIYQLLKNDPFFADFNRVRIHHPLKNFNFTKRVKRDARSKLSLPNRPKLLLFPADVGTADLNKGFALLEKILLHFKKQNNVELELVILGEKPDGYCNKLPYKINFIGRSGNRQFLNAAYSSCDALVLPSRFESFGLVAQEAIQCSLPVVATAGLGMDDIIKNGENGYLASWGDVEAFSAAISAAIQTDLPSQIDLINRFDSVKIGNEYESLYKGLIVTKC